MKLIDAFALQSDEAKDSVESVALPFALKVAIVIKALPPDTLPLPPPEADVVVLVPLEVTMHLVAHDAINSDAFIFTSDGIADVDSELLQDCNNIAVAIDNVEVILFILLIAEFHLCDLCFSLNVIVV